MKRRRWWYAVFSVLPGLAFLVVRGQSATPAYPVLLRAYAEAQALYDQATTLGGSGAEAAEEKWNAKALQQFAALHARLPPSVARYDSLRFHVCFRLGELRHYFEDHAAAIIHYREAMAVSRRGNLPDSLRFKPCLYAGIIHYNQNKFDSAAILFREAEAVQARYRTTLAEAERLYNLLGVLYYEQGNYRQAQNYFRAALAALSPTNPYHNELSVNYNINLAQIHLRLEEYDRAYAIYRQLLPRGLHLNEIHHNTGTLHLALGAPDKALQSFRRVRYQGSGKEVRLANGMGEAFLALGKLDSAFAQFQKAATTHRSLGQNGDPVGYGMALKNLGDLALRQGRPAAALAQYQQALQQFYPAFRGTDIHQNPASFSGVFSYIQLFDALQAKATAWHRLSSAGGGQPALKQELAAYTAAFDLMAYVERTYDSDEARLFLARIKYAVHGRPIDAAYRLYHQNGQRQYLEMLYRFDQQNKAAVLALQRERTELSPRLSSADAERERRLKTEITRLSIRASRLTDSLQLAGLSETIRRNEIALGKIQERLLAAAPQQSGTRLPSLDELRQKLLDKDAALVSYHLSTDQLTTLVVTTTDVKCYQQPLPSSFLQGLSAFITGLHQPTDRPRRPDSLYHRLLLHGVPLGTVSRLVIIPDDMLCYLPFDCLTDGKGRPLLANAAVQYHFTTALLGRESFRFANASVLSFAPFARQGWTDSFSQLRSSAAEVASNKGLRFLDSVATKERFLEHSARFPVLHLATHAVAGSGGKLSYIVFSPAGNRGDNLLYAQEIDDLSLQNTRLVVLSACETGAGDLVQGEGVLSLSRAFSYAGCPNIITSLWKADDASTAYLVSRMHHYLRRGETPALALRQAKLDYLGDKRIHPRLKQPYYWSHLVLVGNYAPAEKKQLAWWMLAGLLAAATGAVWWRYKSIQQRRAGR